MPIAIYRDKTIFPGSATLKIIQLEPYPIVEKTYEMDTISVKMLGGSRISDAIYHPAHRIFTALYLNLGSLRPAMNRVIGFSDTTGVKTSFQATKPRGRVIVRYTIHPDQIDVETNSEMIEGCEELIDAQRAGGVHFPEYAG